MNLKRHFKISFIDILTVVYCGFCVLELNSSNYKYICLALLFSWMFVAFFTDNQAMKSIIRNKIVLLLVLYALIYFFYVSFTRNIIYGIKYAFSIIISESPFMLFLYYERRMKKIQFAKILPWIEFIVILYLCTNILKLIAIDPNAARKMAASTNIYQNFVTGGGYQIAYVLCLLVPFLIFTFKEYRFKIITLFFIFAFAYTLIKCSYTIALLLATFELILLFYWSKNVAIRHRIVAVMIFMVVVTLFFVLREPIGDFFIEHISPLFSGSFVQRRMAEFGEFIKGNASNTNGASARVELYGISINTFFKNPLIGISYRTKFIVDLEANLNGVRNLGIHSTIFDGFARIGLSFIIFIVYYWKAIRCIKKKVGTNIVMIVGTVFFLIKTLNVADAFGLTYVAYFAIPILCKSITEKRISGGDLYESSK